MTALVSQVEVVTASVHRGWLREIAVIIKDNDGDQTHVHMTAAQAQLLVSDLATQLDEVDQ